MMKVKITSVLVLDQEKALKFYTGKLGFIKKVDIPLGDQGRWLTVVSPQEQDGTEVLLEPGPVHFEPARIYQKALFDAGIPFTQFYVEDIEQEFRRLSGLEVNFSLSPTEMGTVKVAVFDDTCGNNIQLVQML